MPELPEQIRSRYVDTWLSDYNAELLTGSREIAAYFEQALLQARAFRELLANWILATSPPPV